MPRITTAALTTLMGAGQINDLGSTTVELYINSASRFVDRQLADQELTEQQLVDIELFLAAYFIHARKAPPVSVSMGGVSSSRQGLFAFAGMLGDVYGQRAIELDTSGTLAELATALNAAARGQSNTPAGPSVFSAMSDADPTRLR